VAVSYTPKLGLYKAVKGDEPGVWATNFSAAQDDADARFMKSGAGSPNDGAVEVNFIGQRYYDTTDGYEWVGGTTGTPPVGNWLPARMERGAIGGLRLIRVNAQDIRVAVGEAADAVGKRRLLNTALKTKQIDATWAAGSGAGGFPDTISILPDTWYHVFLIGKPDGTVDVGFDSNISASNLLTDTVVAAAGYTLYRRIGSVHTNETASPEEIDDFTQRGDLFMFNDVNSLSLDYDAAVGDSSRTAVTLRVPNGVNVRPICNIHLDHISGRAYIYISPIDAVDTQPGLTTPPLSFHYMQINAEKFFDELAGTVFTDVSSQIGVRADRANTTVRIITLGWIDDRGRND
jgi:hypothetical protein